MPNQCLRQTLAQLWSNVTRFAELLYYHCSITVLSLCLQILALVVLAFSSSYADREREGLCVKDCLTVWKWCMLENKNMPNHIKAFHRNGCKSNEVRCVDSCSRRLLDQINTWFE